MPEGPFDFGRDLFPLLLKQGERLHGAVMEGYWCDIGTPQAYYRCCADALDGKLRLTPGSTSGQRGAGKRRREEEGVCRLRLPRTGRSSWARSRS